MLNVQLPNGQTVQVARLGLTLGGKPDETDPAAVTAQITNVIGEIADDSLEVIDLED